MPDLVAATRSQQRLTRRRRIYAGALGTWVAALNAATGSGLVWTVVLVVVAVAAFLWMARPRPTPVEAYTVVTEAGPPTDSNGYRLMEWCVCGSTEDSSPVTVDVDGDGNEDTIGWLCPTCRGDRHGPDPEPKRPTPPHRPPPMPNPVDTDTTLDAIKRYWMGNDARPAAILGPGVEVKTITVYGKPVEVTRKWGKVEDVAADDVSLAQMRKALGERIREVDAILNACDADSTAVYMSERQVKDVQRLRDECDALAAGIKERQSDPTLVLLERQVRCYPGHVFTEIHSHEDVNPLWSVCERCGWRLFPGKCEHPVWHENRNSAGVLTQLQCPCGAVKSPRNYNGQ